MAEKFHTDLCNRGYDRKEQDEPMKTNELLQKIKDSPSDLVARVRCGELPVQALKMSLESMEHRMASEPGYADVVTLAHHQATQEALRILESSKKRDPLKY